MSCATNGGYIAGATAVSNAAKAMVAADLVVQAVLAIAQYKVLEDIAKDIHDLAERKYVLAEYIHKHFKNFWPKEKGFVDYAFGEAKHEFDDVPYGTKFYDQANVQANKIDIYEAEIFNNECLIPFGEWFGNNNYSTRSFVAMTELRADAATYGFRVSENRTEALNDRRFSRQYAALGLGKDVLGNINAYTNLAGSAQLTTDQFIVGSVNSAAEAFGYIRYQIKNDGWGNGVKQKAEEDFKSLPSANKQRSITGVEV